MAGLNTERTRTDGLLDLPVTLRWCRQLTRSLREGSGSWYVLSAPAQSGKTSAVRRFQEGFARTKEDGLTSCPVAVVYPPAYQGSILPELGNQIGAGRLARGPEVEVRMPTFLRRANVRMIVVLNAHALYYRQIEELLNLDDRCKLKFGLGPVVVFVGIIEDLRLSVLAKRPELIEQFDARVVRSARVPNHNKSETATALELLVKDRCPTALRDPSKWAGLVFELLTRHQGESRDGRVAAGYLDQLVRRIGGVRSELVGTSDEEVIRRAYQDLMQERRQLPSLARRLRQTASV